MRRTFYSVSIALVFSLLFATNSFSRERKMKKIYDKTFAIVYKQRAFKDILIGILFDTTAFELVKFYKEAELQLEGKEYVNQKLVESIKEFTSKSYPDDSEAKIGLFSIFRKEFKKKNGTEFNISNKKHEEAYYEYESNYIQGVIDSFNKHKKLQLNYHPDWGYQKYDRLVFKIYLKNLSSNQPYIADIGKRTFIEDDKGNIYKPEGLVGPYPYTFDKPKLKSLIYEDRYRLFFPTHYKGKPIITKDTKYIKLVIYDLNGVEERELIWEIPFKYPQDDLMPFK